MIEQLIAFSSKQKTLFTEHGAAPTSLHELVGGQIEFVVSDRLLAQVYYNEIHNLPGSDRRRLRRKQRVYIDIWAQLLGEVRTDLNNGEIYATVHASIGAIQSTLFHSIRLSEVRQREVLMAAALSVLGFEPRFGERTRANNQQPAIQQWEESTKGGHNR